ncbi:hypothetical protein CYMTET_37384 [Cymbomonas tetramitiformis]|uniref:Uncharacterized protein n=1 Tax=Cymbomonas tetramitiformis TaxID=36881 RepID=A0AAE0CFV8_9CHLO|nr:hypothetical protein CYMTET_37384 [Cymbomonas tetramitiformis]
MHTLRTYFARASDSPPPTDLANVRTVAREEVGEEAKRIADWTAAARELFVRAKEGAKKRDIDFALPSPDFLADLAEAQKGRCAITGLRMLPRQPAESEGLPSDECWRRFAPSVDRIRSDGHYTRDNVQLTCVFVNVGKAEADDESFKRFLRGLAPDPTDEYSNDVSTILLRPPKREAPTRGDVVKRKREVALLQCDAKENGATEFLDFPFFISDGHEGLMRDFCEQDANAAIRVFAEALQHTKLVILDHGMLQNSQGVAVSKSRAKELLTSAGRKAAEELVRNGWRHGPLWAARGLQKISYDEKNLSLIFGTRGRIYGHAVNLKQRQRDQEGRNVNSSIADALSTEQPNVTRSFALLRRFEFEKDLTPFDRDKHLLNAMRMAASPTLVRNRIQAWRKLNKILPTMPWNRQPTDRGTGWFFSEVHTSEQVRAMIGVDGEYYLYGDGYGDFDDLWRWLFANDLARHTRWYHQKRTDDRTAPLWTLYGVPVSPRLAPSDLGTGRAGSWSSMHRPIIWITRVPTVASRDTPRDVIEKYTKLFRIGVRALLWRKRATERVYHPRNLLPLAENAECEPRFARE